MQLALERNLLNNYIQEEYEDLFDTFILFMTGFPDNGVPSSLADNTGPG